MPVASLTWNVVENLTGKINIERLMTRLDGLMPYDFDLGAAEEFDLLLSQLKKAFIRRLYKAKEGHLFIDELDAFSRHCVENSVNCITFNYDDMLDEALWNVRGTDSPGPVPYWHPDGGYGFYCKPSDSTIREESSREMDVSSILLLKLHGSTNWRPKRGYAQPYSIDAITHHEPWFVSFDGVPPAREAITLHLEAEPFIVPPVLSKSAIVEQPILRLVWHRAYQVLRKAQRVAFVGYSFPPTDFAVRVLFEETIEDLPRADISVVNFARTDTERQALRDTYRTRLGDIDEKQFDFRGALEWAGELTSGQA